MTTLNLKTVSVRYVHVRITAITLECVTILITGPQLGQSKLLQK